MSLMSGVNRLSSERFECHECEKELSNEEVQNTWKCPVCKSLIHVYAEDFESKIKIVLLRKSASEIEVADLVHLPGGLMKESYRVLGINKRGNKLGLSLEGYGQYLVSPKEPINCRTGAW
jgi:ribosomal protein L37AE/L43A